MSKNGKGGTDGKQGGQPQGDGGNWPSKRDGKKSGTDRGNAPPKK